MEASTQINVKPNIRVKLMRLTFYKNPELEPYLKQEFDVARHKPDSQIPYGVMIGGKLVYLHRDEVYVIRPEGAGEEDEEGEGKDQGVKWAEAPVVLPHVRQRGEPKQAKAAPKAQPKVEEEPVAFVPKAGWSFGKKPNA